MSASAANAGGWSNWKCANLDNVVGRLTYEGKTRYIVSCGKVNPSPSPALSRQIYWLCQAPPPPQSDLMTSAASPKKCRHKKRGKRTKKRLRKRTPLLDTRVPPPMIELKNAIRRLESCMIMKKAPSPQTSPLANQQVDQPAADVLLTKKMD